MKHLPNQPIQVKQQLFYKPRASKGIKFQPPGLFLVVSRGTNFTPDWRIQVYIFLEGCEIFSCQISIRFICHIYIYIYKVYIYIYVLYIYIYLLIYKYSAKAWIRLKCSEKVNNILPNSGLKFKGTMIESKESPSTNNSS